MDALSLLHYVSAASIAVPVAASIIKFRFLNYELKALAAFTYITAVLEANAIILASKGINNLHILHLHTIIEVIFLGLMYYFAFHSPLLKKMIIALIVSFTAFAVIDALYIENIRVYNAYPRVIESAIFLCLASLYYKRLIKHLDVPNIIGFPLYWINAGVFIYFISTVAVFSLSNYFLEQSEMNLQLARVIHSIFNILFNILIAIGLWKSPNLSSRSL